MGNSMNARTHGRDQKEKSIFASVFLGTFIALLAGLALLLLLSAVGLSAEDPDKLAPLLSLVSLFVSATLSGYISARGQQKNGLVCGLFAGILLISIAVLAAFAFSFFIRPTLFAIAAPSAVVCSMLGGLCGAKSERRQKPRHKVKF